MKCSAVYVHTSKQFHHISNSNGVKDKEKWPQLRLWLWSQEPKDGLRVPVN